MKTMQKQKNFETWMIINGSTGDHFYSDRPDRHLTAIGSYYGRKIKTERLITVTTGGKKPESNYITKITLL